jgi:hypothetical protein
LDTSLREDHDDLMNIAWQQNVQPRHGKTYEAEPTKTNGTVLGTQIGGDHYTRQKIQPIEYIWANNLGFSEGNVVKYVTRWKFKGGIKDLKKAHHHIALLIEEAERAEREDGVKYGLPS